MKKKMRGAKRVIKTRRRQMERDVTQGGRPLFFRQRDRAKKTGRHGRTGGPNSHVYDGGKKKQFRFFNGKQRKKNLKAGEISPATQTHWGIDKGRVGKKATAV